ncbi:winged helix-turn-helix transcriptional regulator [Haladaptatus sp. ZSTT2]|uniref:winged helix-turn-helix transcriptional regulator n=1 Tax=Haladaptatus sp. ZSTT2 TaxID=3120515 RepID=UPI00300ED631
MKATDDRVRVWVLGTILVAVALVLSPMAVTALPDDPLSGTTNTTDTTNTTLEASTETLTDTPTTTLEANTETLTSTATLSTTLDSTDSTTETTTSATTSTDTLTDEVSAPTPTPTETVDGVESTVEDTATNVVEDVSDGTTTESVDTGDATSELTATTDTLTDGSTDPADTVVETVESTTTATVSVETASTTDLTATTETTVTETAVTTDTVASNPTKTVTETLATDTTTTTEAVVEETDGVTEDTTEDESPTQTNDTTASVEASSSESADVVAVASSASSEERNVAESAETTAAADNATALLPPFSTGSLPEPVPEEPGIALGVGALVTAGAVRYGPAIDWSSFSHVATQASHSAITSRLHAGVERVTRIIAPFRYSRFDDSDPLEHEGRDAVYSAISESPGIYLSAVADRADVPLSTARHHLRVLEDEQLISGAKIRGKRRFYAAHTEGHELAAALNDEATAAVLDALSRLGPSSVSALAADLGRDPSTVTHHLQRLEADDIVVREREGRAVVTRLSPEANAALRPEPEPAPSARIMADGSGVEEGLDQ